MTQIALGAWPEEGLARELLAQVQTAKTKPVSKEAAYGSSVHSCSTRETRVSSLLVKRQA